MVRVRLRLRWLRVQVRVKVHVLVKVRIREGLKGLVNTSFKDLLDRLSTHERTYL